MKPFDLQKAIDGHPLVTRDGREVTEFHYFKSACHEGEPIRCVLGGIIRLYFISGKYFPNEEESKHDLFLKSEKKKLYLKINTKPYLINDGRTSHRTSCAVSNSLDLTYAHGWQIVEVEIDV